MSQDTDPIKEHIPFDKWPCMAVFKMSLFDEPLLIGYT